MKPTFLLFYLVLSILVAPSILAKEQNGEQIKVQKSQLQALGIKTDNAKVVSNAWGASFPAKIVVPNSQLRVVATPLSGLLESLKVSEGEKVKKGQLLAIVHSQDLLQKQSEYLDALTELNLLAAVRREELLDKQSSFLDALTELNLYTAVRGQKLLEQQSDFLESLVELNLATTEMNRDKNLARKGVISKQRFQESKAKYHQLRTRVEQYRQALALAGMTAAAIDKLSKTKKLTPYGISRNNASQGSRSQEYSVKYQQLRTQVERFKQALQLAGMSKSAIKQLQSKQKLIINEQVLQNTIAAGKQPAGKAGNYQVSLVKYRQLKNRAEHYRQVLKLAGMSDIDIKNLSERQILTPKLQVRSPLDGVVLKQLVTPGSQLEALAPIYKVGFLNPLWLEIHVPLDKLGNIQKGTKIKIVKPALKGSVITVGRMVHGADQGILVRAKITKGVEQLRPGQFVQAQIAQANNTSGLSLYRIPRSALVRNEGKTWIFVAIDSGFQPTPVTIEKEETDALVISGKLSSNTNIVVSGIAALKAIWLEEGE